MENKYHDLHELPMTLRVEDLMPILGIGRNTAYELIRSGQTHYLSWTAAHLRRRKVQISHQRRHDALGRPFHCVPPAGTRASGRDGHLSGVREGRFCPWRISTVTYMSCP